MSWKLKNLESSCHRSERKLWNATYNEISIDNKSVPCDRRSGDIEGPREPDPLILALGLDGTSVDFHDSCSKQQIKLNV